VAAAAQLPADQVQGNDQTQRLGCLDSRVTRANDCSGSGELGQGALAAKSKLSKDIEQGRDRPPGHRRHRYTAERAMTSAVATSWNDDPPDMPSPSSGL
jgi:hypothetical protein